MSSHLTSLHSHNTVCQLGYTFSRKLVGLNVCGSRETQVHVLMSKTSTLFLPSHVLFWHVNTFCCCTLTWICYTSYRRKSPQAYMSVCLVKCDRPIENDRDILSNPSSSIRIMRNVMVYALMPFIGHAQKN